ncbi:MAG: hypothetical protein M3228_01180 [Actinomycetota bacterium]|nr:hypothetical protein [Actinomycetota bacterium]
MGRRFCFLAFAALTLVAIAGCGRDDDGPPFNAEDGRDITCMTHQTEPPGSRYTDPERRNTGEVLQVLRYYTAHGSKGYCDNALPNDADGAWVEFYIGQGADRARVAPLFGS